MTTKYNKAGLTAREHYQSSDDPCNYVTDTPDPWHTQINETVDAALQRINEIKESDPDRDTLARSLRCYQLIREMATTAGRKSEPGLKLLAAQIRVVFNQL
jgi:hypothetical protein